MFWAAPIFCSCGHLLCPPRLLTHTQAHLGRTWKTHSDRLNVWVYVWVCVCVCGNHGKVVGLSWILISQLAQQRMYWENGKHMGLCGRFLCKSEPLIKLMFHTMNTINVLEYHSHNLFTHTFLKNKFRVPKYNFSPSKDNYSILVHTAWLYSSAAAWHHECENSTCFFVLWL